MPRPPRLDPPGAPQHLLQRGNDRQPCFFADIEPCFRRDRLLSFRRP